MSPQCPQCLHTALLTAADSPPVSCRRSHYPALQHHTDKQSVSLTTSVTYVMHAIHCMASKQKCDRYKHQCLPDLSAGCEEFSGCACFGYFCCSSAAVLRLRWDRAISTGSSTMGTEQQRWKEPFFFIKMTDIHFS